MLPRFSSYYPLHLRYTEFEDCTVFVDDGDDVSFLVFRHRARHWPHMLFNHISFESCYLRDLGSILRSDHGVVLAVRCLTLYLFGVVFLSVIVEQVVEQPCSCGRTCIELQYAADDVAVI